METEVVAFSNAVAAETTFLLEEDDDDDENVRTSRECERVFSPLPEAHHKSTR